MKKTFDNCSLIILNGGRSSRMNYKDKDLLQINQQTFLERLVSIGKENFQEIIVVGKRRRINDVQFVIDQYQDKGPVGGIYSGLTSSESEKSIVLACDMPFIHHDLFDQLLLLSTKHPNKNIIPKKHDRLLPLSALYLKKNSSFFKQAILEGRLKLLDVLDNMENSIISTEKMNIKSTTFLNINTVDDYLRIEKQSDG